MIMQAQEAISSNLLLVFDVEKMKVVSEATIDSPIEIRKFIRKNNMGYVNYTLTRTSNVYNQRIGFTSKHLAQVAKFQISKQYHLIKQTDNPANCLVDLNEFVVKFGSQGDSSTR